jgi:hypothetical protein
MFHTQGPILRVFKLFLVVIVVAHDDIPRLVALVFRANRFLAMEKDIKKVFVMLL